MIRLAEPEDPRLLAGVLTYTLRPGAVDDSRARLKPEIPEMGEYGIPLRDEIELEKPL